MARRLGTAGYYVVLPNLYYRSVREFDYTSGDPTETRATMFSLMSTLDHKLVTADTEALLAYVGRDKPADATRIGCMGYCMSGPFSFGMAGQFPDRIKAAASIYGVNLFGEGSPAHLAGKVRGELYFACAETDIYAPKEMIDKLEHHLDEVDAKARVEWYPGTEHGFAFPNRPAYNKAAAERHWERLHSLFARNLQNR
jgi:carboxymethylenebutenolidase